MVAASGAFLRSAWGAQARFIVADTALGKVRGVDVDGIQTFKGIPYGANTAGKNRFMPPVNRSDDQGFSPTVDGAVLPTHPFHPTASPVSASVPVMVGCTRTELTSRGDAASFALTEEGMHGRIRNLLGASADRVIEVYRNANPGATASDIYFLIASDHAYGAPIMKIAERRAALGAAPVYLYYFRWESPIDGGRLKSPHTIEIPFVFDTVKVARLTASSPDAPALADKVNDAWIAFARKGDPNISKLPRWPAFDPKNRPTMVFNNQRKVENDPIREERLAMFSAMNLT